MNVYVLVHSLIEPFYKKIVIKMVPMMPSHSATDENVNMWFFFNKKLLDMCYLQCVICSKPSALLQ